MASEIIWIIQDRYGNEIYLTYERWEHIVEPMNHPDMADYMEELKEMIRIGRRKQDLFNPQKYRYTKAFDYLDEDNTHIVAIVLCRFREGEQGQPEPNNYIVTAFQKEIG